MLNILQYPLIIRKWWLYLLQQTIEPVRQYYFIRSLLPI